MNKKKIGISNEPLISSAIWLYHGRVPSAEITIICTSVSAGCIMLTAAEPVRNETVKARIEPEASS